MGRVKDLTGMKFGRLTVIKECGRDKYGQALWLCRCECGNKVVVRGGNLRRGNTTSCGCYKSDKMKEMWKDEEFKQMQTDKAKEQMKEMWKDEEFKQMQSNKTREQWKDKEFRQMQSDRMREQMKEQWKDEEFRQMQNDRLKEMWKDEEYRQMQSEQRRRMNEEMWKDEEFKQMRKERVGKNSPNWKGGITPVSMYLRNLPIVVKWMEDAKENVKYTCELVGKQCYIETHHIKPFCELVVEAHVLNGIQIKEIIADYTEEELKLLVAYITKWHQDFSNAIVLSKDVHDYFHNVFMKGKGRESSVEDVEEFKQRYLNGEFKVLLGNDLNV